MEKKDFKDLSVLRLEKAFRSVLILAFVSVIGSVIVSLFVFFKSDQKVRELSKSVVVLDNLGAMQMGSVKEVNVTDLNKMRAQNVMRIGVDYMYSFSATTFDSRISFARFYFGKSGNEILTNYKNTNVREKVMSNNLIVDVVIKQMKVFYENNQLKGNILFEQSFINGSAVSKRDILAQCDFVTVQPSAENSNGFLIENWIIK